VDGGEIFSPKPKGQLSILTLGRNIRQVGGEIDWRNLERAGLNIEHLDAHGCLVVPALIDVHEHLIGGSGERGGFSTQTPEIFLRELLLAGVATVVGCLGTDCVTRTMAALLGKAKALREQGIAAFLYTGGYPVPPATLTGSIDSDILFVDEIIGAGEVAIADYRSSAPSTAELARLVRQAAVAGMLAGKAGVTHFHVGEENGRLQVLRELLDKHEIAPEVIYPTHVERTEALFDEAIELTRRGVTVDVDTMEEDLPKWFGRYADRDGDPERLTASSDAAIMGPRTLLEQVFKCLEAGFPAERVFRLTSTNPARILKLRNKGELRQEFEADVLALDRASGGVRHLLAAGRILVRDGQPIPENWVAKSNRRIEIHGKTR